MAKRTFDFNLVPSISELYKKGNSISTIGKILNISSTSIHRNLKDTGLFKNNNDSRNRKVTNNPFTDLNKEDVQYWLGFIAADGCIHSKTNAISLNLSNKDETHLDKYIYFLKPNTIKKSYVDKTKSVSFSFNNKEIKDYLIQIGLTPRKTKSIQLQFPLTNHVLRGLFDGDGCFSIAKYPNRKSIKWSLVTASKQLFIQISNYLEVSGIEYKVYFSNNLYLISISNKANIKKMYNLLYKNATVFLERKHSKMQAAIAEML